MDFTSKADKRRRQPLLVLICYSCFATLTIFYGLVEKHSLFITFVGFHLVTCLIIPIFHAYWEGNLAIKWREAWGLHRHQERKLKGIWWGIISGVLLFILICLGFYVLLWTGASTEWMRNKLFSWGLTEETKWWFALYMTIGNSLFEEMLWRGFLLERLLYNMQLYKAILLSSFFYSLYHFIIGVTLFGIKAGLVATFLVFLTGMFWAWLRRRYQSIYPTWISHLFADWALMYTMLRNVL
ncbi:CPBP family intramembrane glutamic endopeptidase [Brevibacillus laterosporus]|uniref:CPBP family intramembrane metalloprotease n=1 Tax=Brevibacillus laterosporus TaxID=1465 RepID=A0AAP8QDZ5_BRELA|nr:type II CAAX endopeptidase family protein [Brevibacillus laterosporus]MBG9772604.1 metallopeptidase [Brevibacillus laterosporus]MBG9788225.1 metallopeptidase [Brevibacillus laterosporus]MBG9799823.1 metallopeptidase [Brevibacillus laterosporus]MCG7316669.1 CPBP family intramembrane metalloprotease [Brevibacillus laterosporus]MCR8980411.1 CPBP family intramembrane metalloprotease [Brevibacillus laterosporus]